MMPLTRKPYELAMIKPIRNETDCQAALAAIETLMGAQPGTEEGDRLDVLVTLVEAWERKNCPLDMADPVEAIKFYMEQNDLTPRDLMPLLGPRSRVSEILHRKRPLTLRMIRNLYAAFHLPADVLLQESAPAR